MVEDWWRRGELLAGDWPQGVVRCHLPWRACCLQDQFSYHRLCLRLTKYRIQREEENNYYKQEIKQYMIFLFVTEQSQCPTESVACGLKKLTHSDLAAAQPQGLSLSTQNHPCGVASVLELRVLAIFTFC